MENMLTRHQRYKASIQVRQHDKWFKNCFDDTLRSGESAHNAEAMQQNNMTMYRKGTWKIQQHETKQDKSLCECMIGF